MLRPSASCESCPSAGVSKRAFSNALSVILLAAQGWQNKDIATEVELWIGARWRCGASAFWTAASMRCARTRRARGARRA